MDMRYREAWGGSQGNDGHSERHGFRTALEFTRIEGQTALLQEEDNSVAQRQGPVQPGVIRLFV